MADHTLTIRLQPGRTNRIKLTQGNGSRPLFGLYVDPGDRITWTSKDQGGAPKISRWLVSFLQNEWSRRPPEPRNPGTPLRDAAGDEVWQVTGDPGTPSVDTWVSHDARDFQFALAAVDENGELYALDPEIRVRAPLVPTTRKDEAKSRTTGG